MKVYATVVFHSTDMFSYGTHPHMTFLTAKTASASHNGGVEAHTGRNRGYCVFLSVPDPDICLWDRSLFPLHLLDVELSI
jgi:hypothetical protein